MVGVLGGWLPAHLPTAFAGHAAAYSIPEYAAVCGVCEEPSVDPWMLHDSAARTQVCLMAARSKLVLSAQDPVLSLVGTLEDPWHPQVRFPAVVNGAYR
jgi:hypothetical protein